MATLTEVSVVARKSVKIGIGVLIFLIFYPFLKSGIINLYLRLRPTPPPPPTVKFGKLPYLQFPTTDQPTKPQIKLETISGGLPQLPPTAKVYLVSTNKSRLLTLDSYRQKAVAINLSSAPVQIDDRHYRFPHPRIQAYMTVDLITDQIEYKYDWTKDKNLITPGLLRDPNSEIGEAGNFLGQLGIFQSDLRSGSGKVSYYTATGSAFVPTDNYNEATFARVDLFRSDLDKMKIVTPGGNFSPVNVTFSSTNNSETKVVSANYYYSKLVGEDIFATYPLRSVNSAYQELLDGKAFIVRSFPSQVIVRNIYLAYYESVTPQDYLQPIYIFEGDNGFLAYVQAVDSSMLQDSQTATPTSK